MTHRRLFSALLVSVSLAACASPAAQEGPTSDIVPGGKADDPEGHANQFAYVTALYADILGRGAGNDEIEGKISQIDSAGAFGVARDMIKSQEYRFNLVTSLYQRFLDRDPDPDGLSAHANSTEMVNGDPLPSMTAMLASDEFFANQSGGTFDGFITAVYKKVLLRDPSPGERPQWNGKSRDQVARSLLTSEEFNKNHLILDWFNDYLDRGPSASERTQFHNLLKNQTHATVQAMLLSSGEYMQGHGSCQATTCQAEGAECGQISNDCAGTIQCGSCPGGETCGADQPNQCGCNQQTCSEQQKECGFVDDGCGNELFCGSCPSGETCGGGGIPNVCGGGSQVGEPLRLTAGNLLEVNHDGSWRGVCDDGFGAVDAEVACRQLGGTLKSFATGRTGPSEFFWLDEVACTGSEQALSLCASNNWGNEDCTSSEYVELNCNLLDNQDGSLRTTNGVLEVLHSGQWRGVCDDGFSNTEAQVACEQMGGSLFSFSTGATGPSSNFWLDQVDCFGGEDRLVDCSHNTFGNEDCGITEHISIDCF